MLSPTDQAKELLNLAKLVLGRGVVSLEGGPGVFLTGFQDLPRWGLSTAREVHQGARCCPHRNAIIDDDGVITYAQLRDNSRKLAQWLVKYKEEELGGDPSRSELRIGIMARNSRYFLYPLTAKGYAGGAVFLLNVGSSPEQITGCVEENKINIVFADDEFEDRIPSDLGIPVVWAHTSRDHGRTNEAPLTIDKILLSDEELPKLPVFPKHGDLVLMSSGTTGIPKGILRDEPKLPFVVSGLLGAAPWHSNMTLQLSASMFHTWGWSCINVALASRSTIAMMRHFDPEKAFKQLADYKCDGMISSPIFFKQMTALEGNERFDTSNLKFILSAGNALTPQAVADVHERFGPILANIYGSTELSLATAATAEEIAVDPTVAGRVVPGTVLKLYDDEGNEVPKGQIGRIFLNNETAMKGYSNPNTKVDIIDGLIEMGDLGYFDDEDRLHVLGRSDDMIIVGGENVHPQSVVEVLETMPGIGDVHAGGVDDEQWFKRIAVWVVRGDDEHGRALTPESIRTWVKQTLADHSVPRDVNFVDSLPRNATGKVMARFLPPSQRDQGV
ncbi:AMP-binding protein [Corynebacterium aquatimens]